MINPITGNEDWNEGVGAAPIQTDKGAFATDWTKVKAAGVQMALPMAKTYAVKDAVEQFGKLFGKDVARKSQIDYDNILKKENVDHVSDRLSKLIDIAETVENLEELALESEIPEDLKLKFDARYKELSK